MKYSLIVLLLLFIAGCNINKSINEEKLVNIYTDILISEDSTSNGLKKIKQDVFKKYDVTEDQYIKAINKLKENPRRWEQFFKKAEEKIGKIR